jgi:hypothetical protein
MCCDCPAVLEERRGWTSRHYSRWRFARPDANRLHKLLLGARSEEKSARNERSDYFKGCTADSLGILLRGAAFELLMDLSMTRAPGSPGTVRVSSTALALFASSPLKNGGA